jgi:PAS domain S-box-containing protein
MSKSSRMLDPHEATRWEDEAVQLLTDARRDLADQHSQIKKLKKILNLVTEGIVVINSNADVELINPTAERLLGKTISDLKLENWDLFLEDGITPFLGLQALLGRVMLGETIEEELRIHRPGMTESSWISISAQPLQMDDDKTSAVLLRIQDASKLKQGQQNVSPFESYRDLLLRFTNELASASDSLDDVLENITHFAATLIGDACLLAMVSDDRQSLEIRAFHHTSPEAQALLHFSLTSLKYSASLGIAREVIKTGKAVLLASIPENQEGVITPLEHTEYAKRLGISSLIIVPIIVRREVIGILECSCERGGKPYTLDDQLLLKEIAERGALAIDRARLQDSLQAHVNELVTAQKALHVNEARFQTIFNASPSGIMLLDIDGRLLQFNSRLCEILGYASQELSGRFLSDFIHKQMVILFERALREFQAAAANPQQLAVLFKRKDERKVWAELNLGAVRNPNGEIEQIVGILFDINARKEMEAELQEMNHQLLESLERERLQLALELHDGPMQELHSVTFQLENLRQTLGTDPPELVSEIKESILQTIQNLRKTAKELRPPALMDFGLEKAIRSYADEIYEKYPYLTIRLELTADRNLLSDNVRLALFRIYQQAMMNIIRHAEAKEVRVRFTLDAEEIELEIQDDGKGFIIPEHWIQFVRQGHYGLAGSAERVQALGGEFQVQSAPDQGTHIKIRIPQIQSELSRQPAAATGKTR